MSQSRTRRPDRPENYWPEILRIVCDAIPAADTPAGRGLIVHERTMTRAEVIETYGIDPTPKRA